MAFMKLKMPQAVSTAPVEGLAVSVESPLWS